MNYDKLEHQPNLYKIGMYNLHFNVLIFWRWYLYAFTMGLLLYWQISSIFTWAITNADFQGEMFDMWSLGTAMLFCIVFVVNLKLIISTSTHNTFSVFLIVFSLGSFIGVLWWISLFQSNPGFDVFNILMKNHIFAITMILMIASCILCEYSWRSLHFIVEEILVRTNIIRNRQNSGFTIFSHSLANPITKSRNPTVISKLENEIKEEKKEAPENYNFDSTNSINNLNQDVYIDSTSQAGLDVERIEEQQVIIKSSKNDPDQRAIVNLNRRCIHIN
jgi:hypothetical protein